MILPEIIKSIAEYWDEEWEGYKIITNLQCIDFKISNQESCCENWGHMSSDDNLNHYINSILLDIVLVDSKLDLHPVILESVGEWTSNSDADKDDWGERYIFANVITNCGTLQFAIYNCHNGYYGHQVEIKSRQLNMETNI
jgi:hypothetical protein